MATECPSPDEVTSISPEAQERIKRNREEARKKLLANKRLHIDNEQLSQNSSVIKGQGDQQGQGHAPPIAKKRKTAQEERLFNDLQDVVHKGTVVRVQGSKLIDTGGGFLIEERDLIEQEEAPVKIVKEPAPFLPGDTPICEECNFEFIASFLHTTFDHPICDSCKDQEEKHKFITRTDAKNEFFLKDVDIDRREPILKFLTRPNPHNSHWGDMKLYLRLQIEKRAIEVWGSLDKIEEEREVREENRVKTKIKKYNKKMSTLRKSARSSLYIKDLSSHVHTWGPETYNKEDDEYSHKCTECSQEETYEKM